MLLRRLRGRDGDEVVVIAAPHQVGHRLEVKVFLAAASSVAGHRPPSRLALGHDGVHVPVLDAVVREPRPGVIRIGRDGFVDV